VCRVKVVFFSGHILESLKEIMIYREVRDPSGSGHLRVKMMLQAIVSRLWK